MRRFSRNVVEQIWSLEKYRNMIFELLALAGHFELIYHSPDTSEWIIPQRLPDQPLAASRSIADQPAVIYEYPDFMPQGLLWQLMVRMNRHIQDQSRVWRYGVIFQRDHSKAQLTEVYSSNRIEVRLAGTNSRDLHTLIAEHFDIIHGRYHHFKPERKIYCRCSKCLESDMPYKFNFEDLINRMKNNKQDAECQYSFEEPLLSDLLGFLYSDDYLVKLIQAKPDMERDIKKSKLDSQLPAVYFSYAWGDEDEKGESREKLVEELYESLGKDNYHLKHDKMDIGYKGLISEFIKEIGKGDIVIVALSEKYLRSHYCMNELLEIDKINQSDKGKFVQCVYPLWAEELPLNDLKFKGQLYDFWRNKEEVFDKHVANYRDMMSADEFREYEIVKNIKENISRLLTFVKDMNVLNRKLLSKDNFAVIKRAIDDRLARR